MAAVHDLAVDWDNFSRYEFSYSDYVPADYTPEASCGGAGGGGSLHQQHRHPPLTGQPSPVLPQPGGVAASLRHLQADPGVPGVPGGGGE